MGGLVSLVREWIEEQAESYREYYRTVREAEVVRVHAMNNEAQTQTARYQAARSEVEFERTYNRQPSLYSLRRGIYKLDKQAERMEKNGFAFGPIGETWAEGTANTKRGDNS